MAPPLAGPLNNGPSPLPIGPNGEAPGGVPAVAVGDMDFDVGDGGPEPVDAAGALVTETGDGGSVIDFDPADPLSGSWPFTEVPHEDNLAAHIPSTELNGIGMRLKEAVEQDLRSRESWEQALAKGIELLGIKNEIRSVPFKGASGVTDPMIMEAIIRFQAMARGELLPAQGPVKTEIVGAQDEDIIARATRVQSFLNLFLTDMAPEYYSDYDRMLWWQALEGSAFKKIYQDQILGRPVSPFIQATEIIVPYSAADLWTSPRVTHRFPINERDIRVKQRRGEYIYEENLGDPADPQSSRGYVQQTADQTMGLDPQLNLEVDKDYIFYEVHCDLDLDSMPHQEPNPATGLMENTGIPMPYRVTLDSQTGKVFAIYRNWEASDPSYARIQWFVHYPFIPGMGFYGLGYAHILGSHARAATAIRRQAIDAATLATMPSGLRARGARITDNNITLAPLEFPEVETGGQPINNFIMPLPFRAPDQTMVELLRETYTAAKSLASSTEIAVGEGRQDAPVGTTIALIEAATRVETGIMKRCHEAMKRELRMIAALFGKHLDPNEVYPYRITGDRPLPIQPDFSTERVDVIPVSDPNIASATQRIVRAQALLSLAMQAPQIHSLPVAYKIMYTEMGLDSDEINALLPPPAQAQPMDPLSENQAVLTQKPVTTAIWQDHAAHIAAHQPLGQLPAMAAHIAEHVAQQMRVQVQMALGVQLPPAGAQLPPQIQNQVAIAVAQAMQKMQADQAAAANGGMPGNPVVTELQIQALDTIRKWQEAQGQQQADIYKANLDFQSKALDRQAKLSVAQIKAGATEQVHGLNPSYPTQ